MSCLAGNGLRFEFGLRPAPRRPFQNSGEDDVSLEKGMKSTYYEIVCMDGEYAGGLRGRMSRR